MNFPAWFVDILFGTSWEADWYYPRESDGYREWVASLTLQWSLFA